MDRENSNIKIITVKIEIIIITEEEITEIITRTVETITKIIIVIIKEGTTVITMAIVLITWVTKINNNSQWITWINNRFVNLKLN